MAVKFTQAQGGGIKGSSTCDHIFILRSLMNIALKQKRETYLTFYDVQKAFDNVDNNDMLAVMWESGLRGKVWRVLREFCEGLTSVVRTRHGLTREIIMEIGGKQGSKLTGRLFAKLMDKLSEMVITEGLGVKIKEELIIGALLWVDDVVSCVDGKQNQFEILSKMDTFAKDHKLQWGANKCKVMPLSKCDIKQWPFGDLVIESCEEYKYLGDVITKDGKNTKNITERKNKVMATTISIASLASNEVLTKMETPVLLQLHEQMTIPSLLNNAEAWNLLVKEQKEIEQTEIMCL